jgi:cellulose synthase/poly-beta-1,6-N-acetylglucosamine synthase-like glycosyltransferase
MKPLSPLHEIPTTRKLVLSRIAVILTVIFWVAYVLYIIIRQLIDGPQSYYFTMEAFFYSLVVTLLTFSALMYLIMRLGALERFGKHSRVPRVLLERHFTQKESSITVLVPSYNEEVAVIRKTLFSAAIQEYPSKRVVLLIDDNPFPTDPKVKEKLDRTRDIAKEIEMVLQVPYARFAKAYSEFKKKYSSIRGPLPVKAVHSLSKEYDWAATYLYELAQNERVEDHVDMFFVEEVIKGLADDLSLVARAVEMSTADNAQLSYERVLQLYQRLVWIFNCELKFFERKRFASLSNEANKAMNLNSYIGLMGGIYKQEVTPDGTILSKVDKRTSPEDLEIPDSEYLLTLDADSILLRDYCLRLVYFLEQAGNEKVAVVQTPYSSYRGAFTRIERISGATTDIQHILHQGMSKFDATFWVGANAVIRKIALEDIVEREWIGGFEIKRYIQDRTPIEDTESSIDLAVHGWELMNYPERLSYSATPPDFGSLVIQRRRWADGGLLILPKLWQVIRRKSRYNEEMPWLGILLRVNYMASIAWASFGLVFLLAYPFNGHLLSPLVLLTALPYFIAMAVDLKYCRYSYLDIFSIYGFNLILLPVNLAGVLKSVEQMFTGKKIPFARTPKIKNRTASGFLYVVSPILIIGFSIYIMIMNINERNWGNAAFAGLNTIAASWAIFTYIGIGPLLTDIWLGITGWLFVDVKPRRNAKKEDDKESISWQSVLYSGEKQGKVPVTSLNNLVMGSVNVSNK